MLVIPAKDELAADRDDSGECCNSKIIGAEEKAQRGDEISALFGSNDGTWK